MPIDGSDTNLAFGGATRIGAVRRVDRDVTDKQSDSKNNRGRQDGSPEPHADIPEDPHDIVEVTHTTAADTPPPPVLRAAPKETNDGERHLDLKV